MVELVDCRGQFCPMPIILLRQAMGRCDEGVVIRVEVDNETAAHNVSQYLEDYGIPVEFVQEEGIFIASFTNRRLEEATVGLGDFPQALSAKSPDTKQVARPNSEAVILIASRHIGTGDDKLGAILMKGFLSTVLDWGHLPGAIMLMNSGVYLSTRAGGAMDIVQELEECGVEFLVCGTCVDYYGLKGQIEVGTISNMYTISARMAEAGRVIRI